MKSIVLCCALCLGISASAALLAADKPAAEAKANPRENLDTAISEGIRLLEAKEYELFIKTFAVPEELKRITAETPLDQIVEGFKTKAGDALNAFRLAKTLKPEMSDEGKKATFKSEGAKGLKRPLVFVKIDKLWYIKN